MLKFSPDSAGKSSPVTCLEMKRPSRGERLGHGGAKTPVQIGGRWGELEVYSGPDLPGGVLMRVSSRKSSAALCIG